MFLKCFYTKANADRKHKWYRTGNRKGFCSQGGYNIIFNGLEENGAEISAAVAKEFKVYYLFSPANLLHPGEIRKMVSERGTEKEKGTDLGLLISKEFIEKNCGQLEIASLQGKGSVFSFALPVHQQKVERM